MFLNKKNKNKIVCIILVVDKNNVELQFNTFNTFIANTIDVYELNLKKILALQLQIKVVGTEK